MNPGDRGRGLSAAALSSVLLVLPFEPRRPTLSVLGLELTVLEVAAAIATAVLLLLHRRRVPALLRRPPLPLALLWGYAAAHLLSAAVAPAERYLAAKFALRMAAAAVFAVAVAASPRDVPRRCLAVLTVACSAVAVLAILEGSGVAGLDPLLDRFRRGPYMMGTMRRASAGSENPNLAAALLLYGLVPAVGAAALRPRPARVVIPLAGLFSLGVLFTYSRGGLVALAAALVTLWAALAFRRVVPATAPAAATLTLLAVTGAFAAAGEGLWHRLTAQSLALGYGARYEPAEAFLSLRLGERRAVRMTLTNTGGRAWSAAVLACSWQEAGNQAAVDWPATARCPPTAVPGRVAAGESVALEATVRAPEREGRYVLLFDLVDAGSAFSSLGVVPAAVPTWVSHSPETAQPFTHAGPPGSGQEGRLALWRVAIAMWREHPLTGVGPDNFRWMHGAYAGWPRRRFQDALIRTGNMFLETAATTGTLGLAALVGIFVATARAGLRSLSRAPRGSPDAVSAAVLLALTLGIAVHGAVDSFLGFTGHYLFLALVVAMASQPPDPPLAPRE